jgi:type IV pilus assembly protein PilN
MIRINLLGVPKARKVRKAAELKVQIAAAGGVLVLILILCAYFWFVLDSKISRLQAEKADATKLLAELKEKVKEVEDFEANKKELEEKNAIIEQLKRNQAGPVHLLDEVSRAIEPLRVWLVTVAARDRVIDVEGKAVTNSDLVEFINNLKASRYFADIELVESRQVEESNVPVYSFKLKCRLVI